MVIAPHVDRAVDNSRGRGHGASGRVVPQLGAGGGIEGVDVVVIAPHVDHAVNDGRGGEHVVSGREAPCQVAIRRIAPRHGAVIAGVRGVVAELHRIVLCCCRNGDNACK